MRTEARATRPDRTPLPRWMLLTLGAALVALLLGAPRGAAAEDGKGEDTPKKDGEEVKKDAPKSQAPAREPLLPQIRAAVKEYKTIVEAGREYFDLNEEQWRGRKALVSELEAHAAQQRWFLKDMPALKWLVAQSRSFHPPLTDRKWQRSQGITDAKGIGGTLHYIKSEGLQITYSVPKKYPKPKDFQKKYPRIEPLPLLLTMHEKRDYAEKHPGQALMKRRYGDKKLWESIYKEWLVLAPQAPAGVFVSKTGQPRAEVFQNPFSVFWKHYHVDFDRVILDGTEDAFTMANSMPIFWGGIIFRGKWKLDDEKKALVQNFAHVPVFVVNNPDLAKELEAAGHTNVTKGIANATLLKWMGEQRRVQPKSFTWNAKRTDQVLPYWINLDGANWTSPKREVKAEVVDTQAEPNTIKINALGIDTLSLFLNDDVVDLDRKVRLVVNGHIEFDDMLGVQDPRIAKVGRDFDFLFNREPLIIRKSMYFGWLTPSRIVQIAVRKPEPKKVAAKKDDTAAAGPKATPDEENRAERLWNKAQDLIKNGLDAKALGVLDRILKLPTNKYTDRARELKTKLAK